MSTDEKERRDLSTLPDAIYSILEDDCDHEVAEENVQWAGEAFKNLLRTRLRSREVKKGEAVLRGSSLGKKDRQLWYQANMPEVAEKMHGKQNFKFLYGDVIELLLAFLSMEAGYPVEKMQESVDLGDGVKGTLDGVIDGTLVDFKSASSYSFDKFVSGGVVFDDPFGYVQQLASYAHAERMKEAGWLVADKVHGDIAWVPLDPLYIETNTPGPRIKELKEIVNADTPPPRCYDDIPEGKSGNRKLSVGCSYCPFKDTCWADANGGQGLRKFFYSRGPVWLTEVKKEPRVGEAVGEPSES